MSEITLETSSGSKEYKAIADGLYVAQIDNVELVDSAVWDETKNGWSDTETTKKWNWKMRLVKPADHDGAIEDVDGEELPTGARCVWKKFNKNPRYSYKGKIELTNFGSALEAAGFDPKADSLNTDDLHGKYVVVALSVKDGFKDPAKKKNTVDDVKKFKGAIEPLDKMMAEALAAYEANKDNVEDVSFEDALKAEKS